jgi:transcriptional regulator with PAS, ATPase and Fis domain
MKQKDFSYYFNLIKSANSQNNFGKAKRYGEIALKRLSSFPISISDEYLLYYNIALTHFRLAEYSRSLDLSYRAYTIASKNKLESVYLADASLLLANNFIFMHNIDQALVQYQKAEWFYQKYRNSPVLKNKQTYIFILIHLGYCYLYKNDLTSLKDIVERKLPSLKELLSTESLPVDYYHMKGEYFKAIKEYRSAQQSFEEGISFGGKLNITRAVFESKLSLASIDILEGKLDTAISKLEFLIKDARRLKLNEFICETGLFLSKCYILNNQTGKAAIVEQRIKPILNKLDIVWFYEKARAFERLYQQLQQSYQKVIKPFYPILVQTVKHHYETSSYKSIVGSSQLITEIFKVIEKIAPTDLPILVQGETGTGKELVAKTIHHNSLRKGKSWLALNCGGVPESLLETELFGHSKGAFTDAYKDKKGYIELASDGTLFLDEIAEMSLNMQQKLLRVLEERRVWRLGSQKPIQVNTRFIFASNKNIEDMVKQKRFRDDLFYRINTIVITLPPLRERKDDIPVLINHFLSKYSSRLHISPLAKESKGDFTIEFSPETLSLLINYPWPGNVRELENEIKRICALYPDILSRMTESLGKVRAYSVSIGQDKLFLDKQFAPVSPVEILSESIRKYQVSDNLQPKNVLTLKEAKDLAEKNHIKEILDLCKGNITEAARLLDYNRTALYKKIKQLKLTIRE